METQTRLSRHNKFISAENIYQKNMSWELFYLRIYMMILINLQDCSMYDNIYVWWLSEEAVSLIESATKINL